MADIKSQQRLNHLPLLTIFFSIVCIVLFIGINLEEDLNNWESYYKWGAPTIIQLFDGAYWGLITSNFVHTDMLHIGFNLYWLWILGKKVELEEGKAPFLFILLSAALISSLAQLAFSDSTGVGLSGIVYALVGFIYLRAKKTTAYKNFLAPTTINIFIFWLILCFILTRTGSWEIGNAAHIGGLLWGLILGSIPTQESLKKWAIGLGYITILVFLILYNPLSTALLAYKAYKYHDAQDIENAIQTYQQILKIDPDSEMAKLNLRQLQIYRMEGQAIEHQANGEYEQARKIYNEILKLDHQNELANKNLPFLQ